MFGLRRSSSIVAVVSTTGPLARPHWGRAQLDPFSHWVMWNFPAGETGITECNSWSPVSDRWFAFLPTPPHERSIVGYRSCAAAENEKQTC